jgi:hypothetical protein
MIAKLFTDKIIELGLPLRRERKTTIQASGEGEHKEHKDLTKVDLIFNLIDFPLDQEEFEEFTRLRNPLNKVILVKDKKPRNFEQLKKNASEPKPEVEGEEHPPEEEEKIELVEDKDRNQALRVVRAYDYKSFIAPKHSVLKLSDLRVMHYEHEIKEGDDVNAQKNNSVNELKERIKTEIKKTEKIYVEYFNQVMKDKPQSRPETAKKSEKDGTKEDEQLEEEAKSKKPVEIIPAGFQENVLKTACEKEDGIADEAEEKPDISNFKLFNSNQSLVDYSKSTIGQLIVSAFKQCSVSDKKLIKSNDIKDLEVLLQKDFKEIDAEKVIEQYAKDPDSTTRGVNTSKNQNYQNKETFHQIPEYEHEDTDRNRCKIVQGSPYHMLFDKLDQLSIQNYLERTLDGDQFNDIEVKIIKNLLLPGTKRHGMPREPTKSLPKRNAKINEITSFSSIGKEQMQRALILKEFAKMMKQREPEREFNFYNRSYLKKYTSDALKYVLTRYLMLNPNIATHYYDNEDGLLVSLYFRNPPGRILRNQWTFNFENSSNFRLFQTFQSE